MIHGSHPHVVASISALLIVAVPLLTRAEGPLLTPAEGPLLTGAESPATPAPIRVGIVGLDTSHAIAFTNLLNADSPKPELAGCRVVAAYPPGSPDIESSVSRVPKYTAEVREKGVAIVDSIDSLLAQVDVVLLETNDGRPHLQQVIPCLRAKKRTFIDKPIAASLRDTLAILDASKTYGTPVFSCSALRFGSDSLAARNGSVGKVLGCDTYGPCAIEPTHPDLFWYGIHGVESLFAVMGTGCTHVTRVHRKDYDMVVGAWEDGRIGSYRGMRAGNSTFGGTVFGQNAVAPVGDYDGYEPLLMEIVRFFRGAPSPIHDDEMIEIVAFMEGADLSKRQGGRPVELRTLIEQARARP